jgi:hypothetical protein
MEQLWHREPGDTVTQCLDGRQPHEAVIEKRKLLHRPVNKRGAQTMTDM